MSLYYFKCYIKILGFCASVELFLPYLNIRSFLLQYVFILHVDMHIVIG